MTYLVKQLELGKVSKLYDYVQRAAYRAGFGLKGFDNPWLVEAHAWQRGERVLDIGAAYSPLPNYLQTTYGVEMWVADDFGAQGDAFWKRGASPQEHAEQFPNVKYVFEQVGDPNKSSLPQNYFDVVYSLSTLEHVPPRAIPAVWKHMGLLLKPGGELIHAVDAFFPSNGGLKKVIAALGFDLLYPFVPRTLKLDKCMGTPQAFTRLAFEALGLRHTMPRSLSVLNMVLHPDILTESYEHGLNRIVKDKQADFMYRRCATLLIHLKKES
jgi:SAM-dependent methyltransferase